MKLKFIGSLTACDESALDIQHVFFWWWSEGGGGGSKLWSLAVYVACLHTESFSKMSSVFLVVEPSKIIFLI